MYQRKTEPSIIPSYTLYGCEDKESFYDQVEVVLCGGFNSGFGRNLE